MNEPPTTNYVIIILFFSLIIGLIFNILLTSTKNKYMNIEILTIFVSVLILIFGYGSTIKYFISNNELLKGIYDIFIEKKIEEIMEYTGPKKYVILSLLFIKKVVDYFIFGAACLVGITLDGIVQFANIGRNILRINGNTMNNTTQT